MRISLSILMFFLIIPFLLIAQTRDTVVMDMDDGLLKSVVTDYYESGAVEQIMYFTSSKKILEPNAKEEAFLRGERINTDKSNRLSRDSTKNYYEDGKLLSVSYPRLALYESYIYDDEGEAIVLERIVMGQRLVFYGKNQTFEIEKPNIIVRGKIGEKKKNELVFKNHSDEEITIQLESNLKAVSVSEKQIVIPGKESHILNVDTEILNTEIFGKITVIRKDEEPIDIPISISGYDLNETDFKGKDHILEFTKRKVVYLKMDSASKLLYVYKDGEIIFDQSIARSTTELDVKKMGKGTFILETVDLGTNEKAHCTLIIK